MKIIKTLLSFLMGLVAMLAVTACTEEPKDTRGSLTGVVYEGNDPVSNVTVSIPALGRSYVTGIDGAFRFNDLIPDSYQVQVSKSGYVTDTRYVDIEAGLTTEIYMTIEREAADAAITVSPSSLNFGTMQTSMSVTVRNNGNVAADWSLDLGYNPWLSASQISGSIDAGRTQSITFSVDRSYVAEPRTAIVNIHAFGDDFPVSVSVSPAGATSEMVVEPSRLDFGTVAGNLSLTIRNTGAAMLSWSSREVPDQLTLSPSQGAVPAGGATTVVVTLDRAGIQGEYMGTFVISDGIRDQSVLVTANVNNGGNTGGGDEPGVNPGDVVVKMGLCAYYRFDGNCDDSANDYHGYEENAPQYVDGVDGQGIKFSKTYKSGVQIPYNLIHSKLFSVSFWVKDLSDGLIFYSPSSDNRNRFTLSMNGGKLGFIASDYENRFHYNNPSHYFSHPNIADNNWHHIVITADYESRYTDWTKTLYVDGRKVGVINEDLTTNLGESDMTKAFVIGGECEVAGRLEVPSMTIDNFRMYDTRILTPDEVKEIYNARQ